MRLINMGTSKSGVSVTVFAICVLIGVSGQGQTASQYDLSWVTIDGGGGTSSGGPYVLTGTIGQPDAAYTSGGKYELLGGFWPGRALCVVEFEDFARLAEYWLVSGIGLPGDIDADNDVDFDDLTQLADYWLCLCPYNWPLK
jgi:hypothetical protein